MNAIKLSISALALTTVIGCANRPSSIPAQYVAHERYVAGNCDQLTNKKLESISKLQIVSKKQNDMANADALGVFLVGVPVSALSGDHEAAVARYKGEIQAIETAQSINKCLFTKFEIPEEVIYEENSDQEQDIF